MIKKDSFRAKWLRFINSGLSYCMHCGLPWNKCESKSVMYTKNRGCFVTCKECWKECSLEELNKYYTDIYFNWLKDGYKEHNLCEILTAVKKEYNLTEDISK